MFLYLKGEWGILGKGIDSPAPRKKDYWVKKVEREMMANAPNLGISFSRRGRRDRRDRECNFSFGSE